MILLKAQDSLSLTEFGQLLRSMRENACLTQEELAERSGLSIRAISDLERGRTKRPHRNSVLLLADALSMDDETSERFRRMARGVRAPASQPRSPLGFEAVATVPFVPGEWFAQAGIAELIEWMRQVLVEVPSRQHGHGAVGSCPRVVQLVSESREVKAAVVVHASTAFRRYFPDGQFYVNAEAGAHGYGALVRRLSRLFGVEQAGAQSQLENQLSHLRARLRSRRALLVLDNVVEPSQISALLPRDAACAVIVTAHRALHLFEGVWTLEVPRVAA